MKAAIKLDLRSFILGIELKNSAPLLAEMSVDKILTPPIVTPSASMQNLDRKVMLASTPPVPQTR